MYTVKMVLIAPYSPRLCPWNSPTVWMAWVGAGYIHSKGRGGREETPTVQAQLVGDTLSTTSPNNHGVLSSPCQASHTDRKVGEWTWDPLKPSCQGGLEQEHGLGVKGWMKLARWHESGERFPNKDNSIFNSREGKRHVLFCFCHWSLTWEQVQVNSDCLVVPSQGV